MTKVKAASETTEVNDDLGQFSKERLWVWLGVVGFFFLGFGIDYLSATKWYHDHIESLVSRDLTRDIGMAFMVAAVVGIAADFIAFGVGRVRTQVKFEKQLEALELLSTELRDFRTPVEGIQHRLTQLLGDEYSSFADCVKDLVEQTIEIKKFAASGSNKGEADPYVSLIEWITREYSVQAATSIRGLRQAIRRNEKNIMIYRASDRFALNRQIFAAQMKNLESGDIYLALANIELYTKFNEDAFAAATCEALRKGVTVRRIYNVCGWATLTEDDRRRACKIIDDQITRFKAAGANFEHAFLSNTDLVAMDRDLRETLETMGQSVSDLKGMFFGLFVHKDKIVLFHPERKDRTTLQMSAYKKEPASKVDDILEPTHLAFFNLLWQACTTDKPQPWVSRTEVQPSVPSTNTASSN